VLEVHAISTDLGTVAAERADPGDRPAQVRLFSPLDVQMTVSLYDARNQITDVFQPPMDFADLLSAPVITPNGTPGIPAETVERPYPIPAGRHEPDDRGRATTGATGVGAPTTLSSSTAAPVYAWGPAAAL